MNSLRRGLAWIAGALAMRSPTAGAYVFEQQVRARLLQQQANRKLFDGTALRVILGGTSSPLPDRDRAKSCVIVVAGARAFVVDTGPESWKTLALMGFPGERIAGVMLTHFHSDHIGDLGEFRLQTWIAGRKYPLPVHGPPGVEMVVAGFNQAYAQDDAYRTARHGAALVPAGAAALAAKPFRVGMPETPDQAEVIIDDGGLKVTAFQVNHPPVRPAVGYRFDYKGRSAVISGDTTKWPNVVTWAKGADLLIHEAQSQRMRKILADVAKSVGNEALAQIMDDIETYHSSPVDAANTANEAGVRLLVYTHFTPPLASAILDPLFFEGVSAIRPKSGWTIGTDGMRFDLPSGSEHIMQSRMPMGLFR
jgi:ribonuclease Z